MTNSTKGQDAAQEKHDLSTPVRYVKGVGESRAALLQRLGIETVGDLLYTLPRRYEDRQALDTVKTLVKGDTATLEGEVMAAGMVRPRYGRDYFEADLSDGHGILQVHWYRAAYLQDQVKVGQRLMVHGKVTRNKGAWLMQHPEFEVVEEDDALSIHMGRVVPVYALTEDLPQRTLRRIMSNAVRDFAGAAVEEVPEHVRRRNRLLPLVEALPQVHFPDTLQAAHRARYRLAFEEFLVMQLILAGRKVRLEHDVEGIALKPPGELRRRFLRELPFRLTGAQQRVLDELRRDLARPRPMHRLLQGDVGSGKTLVAACAMLDAVECGYQAAIMAPTEILAAQHARTLKAYLEPLGLRVRLLAGTHTAAERREALAELKDGTVRIVVGTHAVIQRDVAFERLALAVIDEQHKFGVAQRGTLYEKGACPHILVMTATPIPRTLAMTIYGDLDVSLLDEMPPGRAPIVTRVIDQGKLPKAYQFIKDQVAAGRQAYLVYPLASESEALELKSAETMYEKLVASYFKEERMALLHGQLPSDEKQGIMEQFGLREIDILVATTVVEVGVDQPNATVMLVEHAERFGLAQLHQLRGRVGRGEHKSYCILEGDPKSKDAWRRLKVMEETRDGFRIAEEDLRIRGMGNLLGAEQSGLPRLRVADPMRDVEALAAARREAFELLESDPRLEQEENHSLKTLTQRLLEATQRYLRVG